MASVCLVRAAVDGRAATSFQREFFFTVNDIAHFENDIMPSKGGSILSEGGLVPYEVVSEGIMIRGRHIDRRAAAYFGRRHYAFGGRPTAYFWKAHL